MSDSSDSANSAGRKRQFIQVLVSHEIRLRAFALSLAGNWDAAEDILQEAMVVLWEKFEEFEPGTNFMAWAGRVVYLKAQEHRRRHAKAGVVPFGDEFLSKVADEATRLSDEMADRQRMLEQCVARLRPDQRELLRRRYEQGADIVGIARTLRRTAGAIRETLRRIRKQLFDCISRGLAAGGAA
jgi:RNA polymerase sigma-70 factor (ECF subfamily)